MTSECNEYRDLLPDLVDGQLNHLQRQSVDKHLDHCEACSEALQQLWQLQAAETRWTDQPTPYWNRRQTFFPGTSWLSAWLPNLQWVSSFASVLVLVLVLTQAKVSTADGLSIQFGNPDGISEATLAQVMTELEAKQRLELEQTVANLSTQQVASNQLLLRTVMEMNREERKEDMGSLLTAWDYAQTQRNQQTKESISVLLASQVEDRRNFNQINRLLKQASLEGNNL